jgi:putative ABC transport system permease protein
MWLVSLRDLQWRRRRFLVAVLVAGLVFGMSLLMAGTEFTLYEDGRRIVRSFGADAWVVAEGTSGPFTTSSPIPEAAAAEVAGAAGVEAAEPIVIFHSTLQQDELRDVNIIGYDPGAFVAAEVATGRGLEAPGETVADVALGVSLGDVLEVAGQELRVVGLADEVTWYFGTPTLFMPSRDAQAIAFRGQPLAMAVATKGMPAGLPAGLQALTNEAVVADLERPLAIGLLNLLLWIVAGGVIGSMVYLSAIERTRDFAVFKATGATDRSLLGGLLVQALVLCVASAAVAAVIAWLLVPMFPFAVEIPVAIYLRLAAVVLTVGAVASLAGVRRTVKVEPAQAFGGG